MSTGLCSTSMEGVEGFHVTSVVSQQTKNSNYTHLLTHYQRKHKLLIKAAKGSAADALLDWESGCGG